MKPSHFDYSHMLSRFAVTLSLVCLILTFTGESTSCFGAAKLKGTSRYSFSEQNSKVTFGSDGVVNASSENATGTLQLRLCALDKPYKTGDSKGIQLAVHQLKGLAPGTSYTTISSTVSTTLPGVRKSYYIALLLCEFIDGRYVTVDSIDFDTPKMLEPLPLFSMSGPWSWKASNTGGTIEVQLAKISHRRPGSTGTLKLSILASRQPWSPTVGAYVLGVIKKNPLQPNFSYTNVKNVAQYTKPAPGWYYVTVTLSEFSNGTFYRQAVLQSSKPVQFH